MKLSSDATAAVGVGFSVLGEGDFDVGEL